MPKSRPVLIVFSVLAGLQVLTGAAALGDVIGDQIFGLFAVLVAAIQVGMTFYVQNMVVPTQDVAAYQNSQGDVVAGPAGGVTNGKQVDVVKTELPASEGGTAPRHHRDQTGQVDLMYILGVVVMVLLVIFLITVLT